MKNKVYILILNYNGYEDTIAALESIVNSDYSNYQIVVVDNNSTDKSMEYLLNWAKGSYYAVCDDTNPLNKLRNKNIQKPISYEYYENGDITDQKSCSNNSYPYPIVFIQSGKNLGFAGGNNIGLKYILKENDFDYVWLLNPDTLIKSNTLSILIDYADNLEKNVGIIGTALLYYDKPDTLQALGGNFNPFLCTGKHIYGHQKYDNIDKKAFDTSKIDMIIGASMLIRKNVLNEVGLLSEEYFLYYEEIDYALKAKKYAYGLSLCLDAIVYHKEGSSINKENANFGVSEFSDFYAMRNRLIFTKKFYPYYLPSVIVGLLFSALKRVERKEYMKAANIIKILFGKRDYK